MSRKPTAAQRRVLEAVRDGQVTRYFPWSNRGGRGPRWSAPVKLLLRQDTITRCVDARWLRVGPLPAGELHAPVTLTDIGAAALQGTRLPEEG